jgi:amidophosphoribosyltransferase
MEGRRTLIAAEPTAVERDGFHDECGVFGVHRHAAAAALTALGLHALQHRGQEAAGIVSYDGVQFYTEAFEDGCRA